MTFFTGAKLFNSRICSKSALGCLRLAFGPANGILKFSVFFVFVSIIILFPFLSHASDVEIENDLQNALLQSKALLHRAEAKIRSSQSADAEIKALKDNLENIQASYLLLQERFSIRQEKVNNLGTKAVNRHRTMSEGFSKALEEYINLVESLPSEGGILPATIDRLIVLLDKIVHKKKSPIFGTLPYKHLNYPAKEPKSDPEIIPAYKGGDRTVTPADLNASPEAPFTEDIVYLAQSLNWNPVLIYEHVKNNIETEWYWGCMKGAEETLRQKSGNDCDQASLLVALLRASGFPSRYVRGVIELDTDRLSNLTGISNESNMAEFLQKAGIPFTPVVRGGTIGVFEIEHIWVESEIPYANYRGAIIDEYGKTWLGLDTSIKVTGYDYNDPIDMFSEELAISDQLSAIRDEYLSEVQTQTPLEYLYDKIFEISGLTADSYKLTRSLIPEVMNILPASMQYVQVRITDEYTEIPDELIHKAKFKAADSNGGELFDITLNMFELSNRQIVITYEPETVEDQQIIDSYGGLGNTPSYLVRLRPVLEVNGERLIVASDGLAMGEDYNLTIELISPNGTETIENTHITGNLSVIGVVSQQVVKPEEMSLDDKNAERLLYEEAINYIDRWNQAEEELASLMQLTITRPIPTVVTLGGVIDVTYLLDSPHGFDWKGVYIDASIRAIETEPRSQNPDNRQRTFMQLSSLQGSIIENRIFEDDFEVESISTAKLMQISSQQSGVSSQLIIDNTNIDTILPTLPFDDNIKEDITNAVNQNLTIRIPQSEIVYEDWTGIGYIKENLESGEAGYMLSGMLAGGMTVILPSGWVDQDLLDILSNPYTGERNDDPLSAAQIIKLPKTDKQSGTVGITLGQPLGVYVIDREGRPVKGASVTFRVYMGGGEINGGQTYTATTGSDGTANAHLTLGKYTKDNPYYMNINTDDKYLTQIGLNLVTASVSSNFGEISISQAFEAYGEPDKPVEIKKVLGNGTKGMVNNPGGTLLARVVDKHGNPISNIDIKFSVIKTESRHPDVPLPLEYRTVEFYTNDECDDSYPLYGDCPTRKSITIKTDYYGALVNTIFGNTVYSKYIIEARSMNANILPAFFDLYTTGFRNKDDYIPPAIFIRHLDMVNDEGQIVNAVKAGESLTLQSELFMLYDDYKLEGPKPCPNIVELNCYYLKPGGVVKVKPIKNGTVIYTPITGGRVEETENLQNGQYQTKYTTAPEPAVNKVEALGEATITVPEVWTLLKTGPLIPSYAAEPNELYNPLIPFVQTEYKEDSLQCDAGTCKLNTVNVPLKSGQLVVFFYDWPPVIAGLEQATEYTVYGVDVDISLEPKYIIVNEDGITRIDTAIKYNILPSEYNAISADIDFYRLVNGVPEWTGYIPGDKTQGEGSVILVTGSSIDFNEELFAEAGLNVSSSIEIVSDRLDLPVGQFRMATNDTDENPVIGAVTDGTATVKLQLKVMHNRGAFENLTWTLLDPDILDYSTPSSIKGAFLDGEELVDYVEVNFDTDGISEAIYRAPESFVRWQTTEEDNDKELPYRYLQPTLDISAYFQNGGDPLTQIRLRRPPVVLVHGLWGNAKAWKEFEPQLNDNGLYDILKVDYSETGQVRSIVNHAIELRATIEDALGKAKKQLFSVNKVDIIAHSLGGLLTREYCQQYNAECQDRIRRFITIATPHFGSELADILLVYRNINTRNLFSTNEDCLRSVDNFVRGGRIRVVWPFEKSVEPHPIGPEYGAIDDLATGRLPDFIQSTTLKGRWDQYPPLSETFSAYAIVGITPEGVDGYNLEIWGLWQFVLRRCGFTPENIFGDGNDRIVRGLSQRGDLAYGNTSYIYGTDHFTVRNWPETIDRILLLLDEPSDSILFSK